MKKKVLVVCTLIVLAILLRYTSYIGIIANSDSYWGINAYILLKSSLYSWVDFLYGGVSFSSPLFYAYAFATGLNLIGLAISNTSLLILVLIGLWYGTYRLSLLFLGYDKMTRIIVGLMSLYIIGNEMMRVFLIANTTVIWSLFFLVWAFFFYFRYSENKKPAYVFMSALLMSTALLDLHSALLGLLFIVMHALFTIVWNIVKRENITKPLITMLVFLTLFTLLNSYWLVNNVYSLVQGSSALNTYMSDRKVTDNVLAIYDSYNLLQYNIILSNKNNYTDKLSFKLDTFVSFAIILLASLSVLYIKKNDRSKQLLILLAMCWVLLSFSFGPKGPLGIFNLFWKYVPGFLLFRDFFKFQRLIIFLYIILASFSLINIKDRLKLHSNYIVVLLTVLIGIKLMPIYLVTSVFSPFKIPDYYAQYYRYSNADTRDSASIVMPILSTHLWFDWPQNPHYDIQDPLRYHTSRSLFVNNATVSEAFMDKMNKQTVLALANGDNNTFLHLLTLRNIQEIVIRKDLNKTFLMQKKTDESVNKEFLDVDALIASAEASPLLHKTKAIGALSMYDLREEYVVPHIYIADKLYLSNKPVEDLPAILSNITDRYPAIFFSSQNNRRLPQLKAFVNTHIQDSNTSVQFTKIDPTHYRGVLTNVKRTVPVIFSESFDPGWILTSSKNINTSHFLTNGYANAWIVDPETLCVDNADCIEHADGSFTIPFDISFKPQSLTMIGFAITFVSLFLSILYLLYEAYNSIKRKRI